MEPPLTQACILHRTNGKARLAGVLRPAQRRLLSQSLLDGVEGALKSAGLEVCVVGRDLEDPGYGLDAAFRLAVDSFGTPLLVVMSDLWGVSPAAVTAFCAEPGDVVIARATDGGTGAILIRRAGFEVRLGGSSASRVAESARAAGLVARVLDSTGLDVDIDTASDLQRVPPQ